MGIPANISRNERVLIRALIEEYGEGASSLAELNDVEAENLQGGETLTYVGELQKFVAGVPEPPPPSPGVLDSVTTSFANAAANPQTVNPGTIIWLPEPTYQPSNPPIGYLHANGGNRVRSEYPDLFNAIGTTFNNEGSTGTTFGIPDEDVLDNPYGSDAYRAYVRTGVVSALTGAIVCGALSGSGAFRTYSFSAGNVLTALTPYTTPWNSTQDSMSRNGAYGCAFADGVTNGYLALRRVGGNWFPCTVTPDYGGTVTYACISNTGNWLVIGGSIGTYIYARTGDGSFGDRQQIDTMSWQASVPGAVFNENDTAVIGLGNGRAYRLSVLEDGEWTSAVTRMNTFSSWANAAFHPTNSLIAATDPSGGIQVYSRVGNVLDLVPGAPAGQGGQTAWVDFSADGQYLICGSFQSWGPPYVKAWRVVDQNFTPIAVDASVNRNAWNPAYQCRIPGRTNPTWIQSTDQILLTIVNDTVFSTAGGAVTGNFPGPFVTNQRITAGFIPA
jgi:hypothetical protein